MRECCKTKKGLPADLLAEASIMGHSCTSLMKKA